MSHCLSPRVRADSLYIRFKLHGIDFYKKWGSASNPTHVARMEYICRLISQDIAAESFTNLEKYFKSAELWDWMKVCKAIEAKPENATNKSLVHKLHIEHPRLNGSEHVKAWLDSMKIANATKARYLGAIRSVAPLICEGISYSQKNASQPSPFSAKEQYSIREVADCYGWETDVLISLWLYCGFRPGEVRALKASDFEISSNRLNIKRSMTANGVVKSTKTGKSRVIELPTYEAHKLGVYILEGSQGEYLFPSTKHHSNWTRRIWHPILKRAAILEDQRPYRLRHTAITMAVQKNPAAIAKIAKAYGTSPAVIFEHYLGYVEGAE